VSEDVCAARIETLRGWADAGIDGRVEYDVARRIAEVDRQWDACLAACEFRDVDGNPGPELRATMEQFRTNEAWVRGIALALEGAPVADGIAVLSSELVGASIDGSVGAPDTATIEYDELEVTGLPLTSGLVNDPVNAANGNFVHADRDIATPGFGAVLDVVRTYNSLAALTATRPAGHFGSGWTSMLDVALDVSDADERVVRMTFTDGAIVTFRADSDSPSSPSGRSWEPNTRRSLVLTEHPAESDDGAAAWTVARDNGRRRFHFDRDGHLIGGSELAANYQVTRADEAVTFTETGSKRWIRYHFTGSTLDSSALDSSALESRAHGGGPVSEVTTSDGRRCCYRYDGAGRCVGVDRAIGDLAYNYDDAGFLTSSVDADGVAFFVNTYDPAGRVVGQVAPHGRRSRFEYLDNGGTRITEDDGASGPEGCRAGPSNLLFHDRGGNLTAMHGSDGQAMRAAYDDRGRLIRHVDRAGAITTYDYANGDLITRRTDPDGLFETNDYDDAGRLVRQTDRSGAVYRFTYDADNPHPVRVDGPEGVNVTITYDDRWLPITVTDGDGVTTGFEWDTDGQLKACVNGAGDRTIVGYDETGQLAEVVEPSGRRSTFELDGAKRVTAAIGVDGVAQRFAYTAAGRVLSMATPGPGSWTASYGDHGDVVSVTDAVGATVGFSHDEVGRIVTTTAPDGLVTTQTWDGLGQLRSVTDPAGGETHQTYDRAGRSLAVTDPDGRTFSREIDELGRTVVLIGPDGATWLRTYHPNGQVATVTDPTGALYRFELDAVGRLVAEVGPDGGRHTFTYSPGSRLLTETTPAGRTTTTTYDPAGRPVAATDDDGVTAALAYGPDGESTAIVGGGSGTRFAYDGAGRVGGWSHGALDGAAGGWDQVAETGSRESISGWNSGLGSGTIGWGLDSLSVGCGKDDPATFSFDPRRLLAEVSEPGGVITRVERDIRGRLTGTTTGRSTTSVDYERSGAIARTVDGSGAVATYRTTPAGQVETILFGDDGGGRGLGIMFDRDDAGRPTAVAAFDGNTLASYRYDACGRLIEAAPATTAERSGDRTTLERDGRGFVTAVAGPNAGVTRYERDADGLVVATIDPTGRRTAFRRTPAGRLQGFADTDAGDVPLPAAASAIEARDSAGRLTVDRHGRHYHYDIAGRLAEATSRSGERWFFTYNDLGLLATDTRTLDGSSGEHRERRSFGYDPGGRLVQVVDTGGATQLTYDSVGRRVGRVDPDGGSLTYTWDGLDRLLAVTTTSADGTTRVRRFSHDGLGHVVAVDDVAVGWDSVITNKPVSIGGQRYLRAGLAVRPAEPGAEWFDGTFDDPYGSAGGDGIRLGFRGELTVDGLVFMGDRVYDPATRAFLSKDPLPPRPGTNGSFASPYLYAWSDPVNYVDPSGREPVSIEEFEAWRERQENNRFERAGQAIVDDPWGSLAMATVVVGGAVLLATPFAPIGAGILVGAASSAAIGLATDNFNPRSVAISGAFGAVPGATSVRTAFAVGATESVATQVLVDGRGLDEINLGEVLFEGTFSAALPFLTSRGSANVVPDGPASDIVPTAPGAALSDTETFYRTMSNAELDSLSATGRLTPRGESFVTQDIGYVQQLATRHPTLYETTVQFDMAPGTRDALVSAGARSPGRAVEEAGLGHLPIIRSGMPDVVHIKGELGAINYGLRSGSADIFNCRITGFCEVVNEQMR